MDKIWSPAIRPQCTVFQALCARPSICEKVYVFVNAWAGWRSIRTRNIKMKQTLCYETFWAESTVFKLTNKLCWYHNYFLRYVFMNSCNFWFQLVSTWSKGQILSHCARHMLRIAALSCAGLWFSRCEFSWII